ncbi:DUF4344 domain-containing metallopeptidase [Paracoccus aminophilus]|uniref:Rhodanese domain-containing protein n=1 Tax=Paracoccus aminophilus JCM 7686 TaxID=1367847 RepID=S5XTT7_PARAH|nr:DUF4344 domain-containing metallopeptidase [Paracoccus aminophilus]AGT08572.1 hypothetical protein JCM7686_1471 [Paracoccus aminophilus JCM 7686]
MIDKLWAKPPVRAQKRPVFRLSLLAALIGSCWGGMAQAHDLGELGPALSKPPAEGWKITDEKDLVILDNLDGAKTAQTLSYQAGPPPKPLRSSLLIFTIRSDDPNASVAMTMGGADQGETCILEARASKEAELNCISGLSVDQLGWTADAVKLDGKDRLQIVERDGQAVFLVNDLEMGTIKNRPAMNGEMGVLASGRGLFGLSHFSTYVPKEEDSAPAETSASGAGSGSGSSSSDTVPASGPVAATGGDDLLAQSFARTPDRRGWTQASSDGIYMTGNENESGDERLFALNLPEVTAEGRVTELQLGLIAPGSDGESRYASAGLFWENPRNKNSCTVQVTLSGDGVFLCFDEANRANEVGRLKGVAKLDGNDTLAVVEIGTAMAGFLNGAKIAEVVDDPSMGGDFSLIAADRGTFGFHHLTSGPISGTSTPQSPPATAGADDQRRPEFSMGDDLTGPLPRFGYDNDRTIGAYMGISESILMHELGHALIGELELPSTGPEEDAVDIYSALQMVDPLLFPSGDQSLDNMAQYSATYAALSWYYSGKLSEEAGAPDTPWQDEHTADLKRFRNMFCVMYGAAPAKFADLAAKIGLEESTLQRCESEFQKQNRAWTNILAPHTRVSTFDPGGQLPADAPGAPIEVVFEPSKRQIGEFVRQGFGEALRMSNTRLGTVYALPRPLRITYRDCGQLNAWYAPREGEITMCYDIIEHFAVMISDIEMGTHQGYETPAGSGSPAPKTSDGAGASPAGGATKAASGESGGDLRLDALDELADSGVPQTPRLFASPYRGPTPVRNPYADTVTTLDFYKLLKENENLLILDIRASSPVKTLPLADMVPGIGADGSLSDSLQGRVSSFLDELTQGDKSRPIVVFGDGLQDRAAYNAALRIGSAGYKVSWYRGGLEAWTANDLPLSDVK